MKAEIESRVGNKSLTLCRDSEGMLQLLVHFYDANSRKVSMTIATFAERREALMVFDGRLHALTEAWARETF